MYTAPVGAAKATTTAAAVMLNAAIPLRVEVRPVSTAAVAVARVAGASMRRAVNPAG